MGFRNRRTKVGYPTLTAAQFLAAGGLLYFPTRGYANSPGNEDVVATGGDSTPGQRLGLFPTQLLVDELTNLPKTRDRLPQNALRIPELRPDEPQSTEIGTLLYQWSNTILLEFSCRDLLPNRVLNDPW